MSSAEELTLAIAATADKIKVLKTDKPPKLKDDLAPLIAELLALKVSFKNTTGEDFGPKMEEKKKLVQEKKSEGPSKAELNKLKRKENKAAKREEARDEGGPSEEVSVSPVAVTEADEAFAHLYGDAPIVTSSFMTDKVG
jgi:hypothetical protein